MIRINYVHQAIYFIVFQIIQIPLLYRLILFDKAFGFFYIGFILLIPYGLSRSLVMALGLVSGLIIDVFSNTPGIHASACVFLAFIRDYWFNISNEPTEDETEINLNEIGLWGFIKYTYPLIFVHHSIIFIIENGGLATFGLLFSKIFYSTLLSFLVILTIGFLITPRRRRI